jgi:predicted house-cleaning noncanonical NTP pyrophosphatase (MazG superfamily)
VPVSNKLVRDRIPDIIEANGEYCETRVLDEDEYVQHLHEKLGEELREYQESRDIEELVDLMEIIYTIASHHGVCQTELDQKRETKRRDRGGFTKRLFLMEVTDEGS